ncbi:SubName: Full=Related to RTM1 protein {ECO:0000313/EMBL:CCA67908.1} [Serendipita indica DSM 11827]|nr:SubName: Full=Related to RTM1 protein {ECO:0000313/EMBL:CCA67908.1} [Serendipita indica DSM 11827]
MARQFYAWKQYQPSETAAIIFAVIFGLLLIAHVFQAARARIWYTWPLILSTAIEFVGYVLREWCIKNPHVMAPYIISQVFIILAPACLAANLYMFVGRAMLYVGPGYSIVRPSWITPTFVTLDVVSIATQGMGSAFLFGSETSLDKLKRGRMILILGLFIQLVAFTVFLFFAIWFDRKTTVTLRNHVARLRPLMNSFYISGALILLRSIYRAIEFITVDFTKRPATGYLFNVEWTYYVLDALPITLSILIYNILFPANYLPKNKKETMAQENDQDEVKMDETPA